MNCHMLIPQVAVETQCRCIRSMQAGQKSSARSRGCHLYCLASLPGMPQRSPRRIGQGLHRRLGWNSVRPVGLHPHVYVYTASSLFANAECGVCVKVRHSVRPSSYLPWIRPLSPVARVLSSAACHGRTRCELRGRASPRSNRLAAEPRSLRCLQRLYNELLPEQQSGQHFFGEGGNGMQAEPRVIAQRA